MSFSNKWGLSFVGAAYIPPDMNGRDISRPYNTSSLINQISFLIL